MTTAYLNALDSLRLWFQSGLPRLSLVLEQTLSLSFSLSDKFGLDFSLRPNFTITLYFVLIRCHSKLMVLN